MSDISIPGVTTSKYGTDKLIEGLMKVERVPRDREQRQLDEYKEQQSVWRNLNQLGTKLRDSAKNLYSYNNPFTEKIGESTNDRAVTLSATREAREQSFNVHIKQIAAGDSFLSAEIPKDGKVPKGTYTFSVGDKNISFGWKGGGYSEFIDALNRRGEGLIRSSLIQVTQDSRALLIEAQKTGANQRLVFGDDALTFALNTGIIKKNDKAAITISDTSVVAAPLSNKIITFSSTARASEGLTLEYEISWTEKDIEEEIAPFPEGPDTGTPPAMTYSGITIQNAPFETALSAAIIQEPSTPAVDNNIVSLRTTRGIAIPTEEARSTPEKTTTRVSLSEFGDVNALLVHNRNSNKRFSIENIRIFDPKAAGEYIPTNPVSTAQDALLSYEGINITRNTNTIDDLVPGVTLSLYEPTDKQETITIKPDTEIAKESIISLVGSYNRLMAELNILTQTKPEIISEIQYFTADEIKEAEKNLGMMQGDTTLNGIKYSLQRITTSPYNNTENSSITMLSQLGISTKSAAGGGADSSRLRGYLEIDEKKLDVALKNSIESIKTLFGSDIDGDLIIDSGVAFSLDTQMTPYVRTGGIFSTRTNGLASRISNSEKKIARFDEQLETKEADLKNKYGKMEGALNSLQNQSNSISNFNKQNSNQ